jgi:hypothetical protein
MTVYIKMWWPETTTAVADKCLLEVATRAYVAGQCSQSMHVDVFVLNVFLPRPLILMSKDTAETNQNPKGQCVRTYSQLLAIPKENTKYSCNPVPFSPAFSHMLFDLYPGVYITSTWWRKKGCIDEAVMLFFWSPLHMSGFTKK